MDKIAGRLQTPADSDGNRTDIHLITTSDEVICNADSDNPVTLTEALQSAGTVYIQKTQPAFPCIWAKPMTLADSTE